MRRTTRGLPQPFEKRVKILEKHVLKNKTIVNVPRRCGVGLAWSEARPRGQEVRHGVRLDLALEPPLRCSCRGGHRDQADQFVGSVSFFKRGATFARSSSKSETSHKRV